MNKNILVFILTSIYSFGFAPDHLDGLKIKFSYGEDETSVIEFHEFSAYEMDDETGTNREFAGDYDAQKDGNTVIVTLFSQTQTGANDVYTLNFTTGVTGNGNLQDFEYLQPGEADNTFEATPETNIYKDLIGSGEFRFDVLNGVGEDPLRGTETEFGFAPDHLDGLKIKFSYGEDETSVIEFHEFSAYEMDDETGTNREFAGDYDAQKDGNTVIVTLFSQTQTGANDVYTLNFTTGVTGNGNLQDFEYLQPGEADNTFEATPETNIYKDLIGSGEFRFDVFYDAKHDFNSTGSLHEKHIEFEPIPISDVEVAFEKLAAEFPDLQGARILRAEKMFDALKKSRFAFEIVLDSGISIYLDQNKSFVHAGLSGDFAINKYEIVDAPSINESLSSVIAQEVSDYAIDFVEKEFSAIAGGGYVYRVNFESNGTEFEAHISPDSLSIVLITKDFGGDFADEWRPVDLPEVAEKWLLDTYPDVVDASGNYHYEQRPTPNGQGKEFVAFLEDGTEVIFDANGTNPRPYNPFKEFQQNLSAGLKFDATRSSDLNGAQVHIKRAEEGGENDFGSMLYRISVTNSEVSPESHPSLQQMDISQNLASEQDITLTFTYEVGPPRFYIVSGSDVSAFKHRMPEWDKPGSFTIKARTISPVKTDNSDLSLASTFGITVEMGGERFYEGTIFETQLINQDVGVPTISSPWDPAASFKMNAVPVHETGIRAYIPRRLHSGHYGIMDPDDVRAAVIDENGSLSFIDRSVEYPEEGMQFTGMGFTRTPYKGFEPQLDEFKGPNHLSHDEGGEYLIGEEEFDFDYEEHDPSPNYPESPSNEEEVANSKFDFDGDGFANSYLEVSFWLSPTDTSFPLEVQIGDPVVDPFANLDDSQFGKVSGRVTTTDENGSEVSLEEYDVWFFKVPEPGQDLYSGEPAFFDLERGADGSFVASLPPGLYHAEAFAYDFKNDIPYKPQIAGGLSNPTVFEIVNGDTNITSLDPSSSNFEPSLNFSLEAEFRISHEFAPVEGTVTVAGRDEVDHVFFDLFPVVDGVRQTDYPVYSFGLERGGKIRGEALVGTFEVEVFSPDNSLYLDSVETLEILSKIELEELGKETNEFSIQLLERAMVTVRGSINDSANNPIWAEIVFVDPNDDENRFWPMWDETATGLSEGDFALKIPQGDYKIVAERFDGMYKSAFYDADNNDVADIVSITSNITGIDFVLESRPTATVTIKLLDANTSEPIKYAWFDFFDAEDEFAPIVFPHLGMIDFESDTFDGTYTLSVPGGSYKLELASPEYKEVYQILDESGSVAWETSEWENGATITLTDGNTTDLGTVNLDATGFSDAEFYGFGWLEEGEDLAGGSTITGKVETSSQIAVPKARIIAHSTNYIFWFDHVQTRSDGSYELNNLPVLPEGEEWVVFAEPPFDSESFQGFRESVQTVVSLGDGETKAVNHVLQGSNVFGRIMFPKKNNATGDTKNEGLGHAFVWAYRDEDQDGEPDWDDDILAGTAMLTEAFGETDKNGFFSFYLEEGGKYSLRIDIPGQLSALAPAPIGFTLKNPNESMKLGNAIKIDWKSDVRATAFDVERKSGTESSYKSLFLDANTTTKPEGQAKSFVDPSVKPGEKYDYRVVAETANGQVTLESSKVRVSEPIIYLAPPSKKITGYVLDGDKTAIAGAEVVAWREEGEGWSSTFTGDDGSYELTAGPGKWEITIYRPYDRKVDWVYDAAPKRVKFTQGSKKESKTKNFTVSRMGGGKIIGSINLPVGVSASDLSTYVYIDAFDPEGRGNWGQPESDGSFEIPLQPGEYELSLWIDPALQGFGSPAIKMVRVGKNSVNVGALDLTSRNKTLSGVVKTTTGTALPNVHVWGWSDQGGWVSDTTNINGEYSLAVSPGRWEIGYDLPVNEDGSLPPYFVTPPKRLKIKDSDTTKTLNLSVQSAAATVTGVVYGPNGGPVADLNSWVYAREFSSNEDEYANILAEVPLSAKGTFTFPGLPGEYMVGLWMPPGSTFGYAGEKYYKVEVVDGSTVIKDINGTIVPQASFNLLQNDSTIKGSFKLRGQAVTGLTGEVYAIRLDEDGWQSTSIEDDGSYEMILAAGNWALDYYIESDASDRKIPRYPSEPVIVKARQSTTLSQDFILTTASFSIAGKVIYETNRSAVTESSLYVWAFREGSGNLKEHWNEVVTDENGTFSIPVLPGGRYEVGAMLSQELRERGYLDSLVVKANLSSESVTDLNLTISKPSTDNFISGTILDPSGNAVEDAIVYAWSDDGREAYVETDENGAYSLLVPNGVVWHVGAEYSELDENGSESYFATELEVDVSLKSVASKSGLSLQLAAPDFEIPDGTSVTFDPTKDFVTKLPDGSELTIPGGAANVDSSVTEVRIVITPTAKGLSKSADEKPADYGYSIELFDNKGKKVEGNFKKDVILSIPVDVNASLSKGMDINNVEAMYYSTTKDAWDKAKTSTWDKDSSTLTMTTDHFTTFAAVSTPDVSEISSGLAKIEDGAKGDWYTLDWLGYFYDASGGWIYHVELGWLYTKEDEEGNFWFYDNQLGWLWSGKEYFDISVDEKSHLYSDSERNWLFFEYSNGQRKFWSYKNEVWLTPDE